MPVFPRTYTNTLFRTETGVYTKKLLPSTLPGVPRGRKTYFFPYIRVYTEKLWLHTPFLAISGVLAHIFSVYTLFHRANGAKRGEPAKQRGTAEQLFCIYPAGSNADQNMPACAGGGCGKPLLYAPGKSLPDLDSFHQQVLVWTIRRNVESAGRRMRGSGTHKNISVRLKDGVYAPGKERVFTEPSAGCLRRSAHSRKRTSP